MRPTSAECKDKKDKEERNAWLAERSTHTLAERIAFLEERMYDHERKKAVHVPPPTY